MEIETNNKLFDEKSSSFYVTLPSNDSRTRNPSKFTIDLETSLELPGNWSVSLTSISIRNSWLYDYKDNFIRIWHSDSTDFDMNNRINTANHSMTDMEYIDIDISNVDFKQQSTIHIAEELNKTIVERMNVISDDMGKINDEHPDLEIGIFDRIRSEDGLNFSVKWTNYSMYCLLKSLYFKIHLPKILCYRLGFDTNVFEKRDDWEVAKLKPNYMSTIENIYIYSDIIESSIIGQSHAQCFGMIPVNVNYGELIYHRYSSAHYYTLNTSKINSISIEITDSYGKNLISQFGETVVVLHFIKKSI